MKKLLILAIGLSLALALLSACHGDKMGTAVSETPVDPSTLISSGPATACADANENGVCDDQESPGAEAACADADADKVCDDVDDDIDGDGIPNALDESPTVRSGRIFDRLAFTTIENSLPVENAIAFTYDAGQLRALLYKHPSNITGEDQIAEAFDWPDSAPLDSGGDIWHLKGFRITKVGNVSHAVELNAVVKVQREQDRIVNAQVQLTNSDTPVIKDFTIAYEEALEEGKRIRRSVISGPITIDAGTPEEVTTKGRHVCRSSVDGKSCTLFVTNPVVVPATEFSLISMAFDQLKASEGLVTDAQFRLQILETPPTFLTALLTTKHDAATHTTTIEGKLTDATDQLTTFQQWHEGPDIRLAEATRVLVDVIRAVALDYPIFPTDLMLP